MDKLSEEIAKILIAIIGVAILAVIVGKNSKTVEVVTASGKAFSDALKTAISPVL